MTPHCNRGADATLARCNNALSQGGLSEDRWDLIRRLTDHFDGGEAGGGAPAAPGRRRRNIARADLYRPAGIADNAACNGSVQNLSHI